MDPDYRCPRRGACRWRLWQKESGLCTAAAATVPGAYCLVDSQSQYHSRTGQASTLTWKTDYATDVTIDQLGKVDPSGSRAVTPAESTTYHLVAKNDSGTQEATARITVVSSPPPPQQTSGGTDEQLFSRRHQRCVLRLRQL